MKHYLYRVQIVEYPAGAMVFDAEWAPEGWAPSEEYLDRFGTGAFIWPTTNREWKSRSSAVKRKNLIEGFGAKCIIQRSVQIVWPEDGQEHVR